MANLFWILNGNDLGIKGGSSGDHPLLKRTARTSRQRVPGPGAEPVAGRHPLWSAARQPLCCPLGPSVLQQEVGGHVKVII